MFKKPNQLNRLTNKPKYGSFSSLDNLSEDEPKNISVNRYNKNYRGKHTTNPQQQYEPRKPVVQQLPMVQQLPAVKQVQQRKSNRSLKIDPSLHTSWDLGHMESKRSEEWTPVILAGNIDTILKFWSIANVSFACDNFFNDFYGRDFWFFRSGFAPTWSKAKDWNDLRARKIRSKNRPVELVEVVFTNISAKFLLYVILSCIGETIECSDEIMGIRFKSADRNSSIKLWISSSESASLIEKFLLDLNKAEKCATRLCSKQMDHSKKL
jgi:hypothetical protein